MNPSSTPRARRLLPSTFAATVAAGVLAALPGAAQAAGADEAVRAAVQALAPQANIGAIEEAPMPGFRQVLVGGQLLYVSDDGKYLMQGTLFDAREKRDLTAARVAIENRAKIDAVPQDKRVVFGPEGKPRYKVTVFTDFDCGYCRKLHADIAEINKRGIEVDYLFFPRSGVGTPSFDKAVSVWCADDRKAAFTAAKSGVEPKPLTCDNPVAEQYRLGTEVGVNGTPTILAPDGTRLGGYLPPDQLLARLEAISKGK